MDGTDQGTSTSPLARLPVDHRSVLKPAFVVPTVGIVLSEFALYFGRLDVALWGHFLTLFVCALGPLVLEDGDLLQAFALVPLFRLVNLGMPVFVELTLLWFPLVYAPMAPGMYLVAKNADLPDFSLGTKIAVIGAPGAIVLGALLGYVEYTIIEPDALVPALAIPDVLLITVIMVAFVGFVEEFIYRGVIQRTLQQRIGRIGGLVVASALFGLMHSAYHTPAEILFAGTIGLVFGVIYEATDSLLLVTIIHGVLNVFLFALIPLEASLFGIGFA